MNRLCYLLAEFFYSVTPLSKLDETLLDYLAHSVSDAIESGTTETCQDSIREFFPGDVDKEVYEEALANLLQKLVKPEQRQLQPASYTSPSLRFSAAEFCPTSLREPLSTPLTLAHPGDTPKVTENLPTTGHQLENNAKLFVEETEKEGGAEEDAEYDSFENEYYDEIVATSPEQALEMLSSWFPEYDPSLLADIFAASGNDLCAAWSSLTIIGTETNSVTLNTSASTQFQLDPDSFPGLGESANTTAVAASFLSKKFVDAVKLNVTAPNPSPPSVKAPTKSRKTIVQSNEENLAVPWLETGAVVSEMYANDRGRARDLARLRNACYQQATLAYMSGNKALAKQLSQKGRAYAAQMFDAHYSASQAIFNRRNTSLQSNPYVGSGLVDLHGLHLSEAIAWLENQVATKSQQPRVVKVCVGTGHHTKGSRTPARLPVGVQNWLLERNIPYREAQPGLLEIRFA